ncbi:MAG: Rpn family recombination-promoting nuclease/putative transposase [Lachnospiraceae bacterium]|nr:Rpn family recombination-promoting nuclease/putative transposase [Lachnospiraceae bacterium]
MPKKEEPLLKNHRDVQGKTIFSDATLCARFLRENIDHPIIRKVQPEDIEDYTERFIPFFGTEFESDTVKRICIKCDNDEYVFYLISLIEHKSIVDYNITMQLLKYMVCIWTEYEKSFGEKYKDRVRNKSFRYPPILPIVYYEGKDRWTAGMELKDRIEMAEAFGAYVPNFTYELVDIHQISNEELLARGNVMSLIMLLNKIQTVEDLSAFTDIPRDALEDVLHSSAEEVLDILVSVIRTLCKRVNATDKETESCVAKVRMGNMGYLFENMEPMDIQAERRNTAQARAERDAALEELEKMRREVERLRALVPESV